MIRNSTNQLSIKPKLSKQLSLSLVILAVMVSALVLYFFYRFGVRSGHQQYEQNHVVIGQLNQSVQGLRQDLIKSQEDLVFAQRHQQIQEEAYKQMSSAYAGAEQKNRYLGSRLDFYRSIISPQGGQSGPAIQAFDYRIEEGKVVFDVTLIQAIKHKYQIQGELTVKLFSGEILLGQWPESTARSISYQYFQQVSGAIASAVLPDNARILIELNLHDGDSLERWYDVKKVKEASPK